MKEKKFYYFRWILGLILIVIVIVCFLNRRWINDFFRGLSYSPSNMMSQIRDDLDLADKGKFIFNASLPELNQSDDFNEKCRARNEETAVLGCYVEENIYVYNIEDKELDGIRELTTAHELLHAVFERTSESEKERLKPFLEKVYKDNRKILEEDIETYDESEKFEELYVRAGTQVKKLPEELEKHYAEIFKDQDKVVSFYEKYISVFRRVEEELDKLTIEISSISNEIEKKTQEYGQRLEKLNAEITDFNNCAETVGCFESNAVFYERRNVLVLEQGTLETMYNEINALIDNYNEKVDKYNEDVIWHDKLNDMINSNKKPEKIE